MKKNNSVSFVFILCIFVIFFLCSYKFTNAESCPSGVCRAGSCNSGEIDKGEGGCGLGNKCCKIDNGMIEKCCWKQEGVCGSITTTQQMTACTGTVLDGKCPTGCKTNNGSSTFSSCTGSNCEFYNPLGIKTVSEFLNSFLSSLRGIVAVVAIIFIVLGGILYMLSAGSEKMVTRAKLCWTGAVIGLAIVLAAPSFLTEIIKILGGSSGVETAGLTGPSFYDIGVRVLDLLLSIFGIIAIISLVSGGGMYLTAYGDEKRIDTAKKIITYSIIGIVVALSALVIISQISSLITGS